MSRNTTPDRPTCLSPARKSCFVFQGPVLNCIPLFTLQKAHFINRITIMRTHPFCLSLFFLLTIPALLLPADRPAVADNGFEQPGILRARDLLQPGLLKGEMYTVADRVENDGLFNHYTVSSPFGTFTADSTSELHTLITEIKAIAAMKKIRTDETTMEALRTSGKKTVAGLKSLFEEPEKTLQGAVNGVNSLFSRAAVTIGSREVTDSEDSRLAQFIGLSKSKGQIANRFQVNMYSRNPVLQEELDRLALADYMGGLGVGLATAVVPGAGGLLLTTSGTARLLNEAINSTPASELWLRNRDKLLKLGMDSDTVELFLNNPNFSPASATVMVAALEQLRGVADLELPLKVALQASDPDMADTITGTAVLIAGYHNNIGRIKKLAPMARLFCAGKQDGTLAVILPTDHIIWTRQVAAVADELTARARKGVEIWTYGDFSDRARSELNKRGWKVHPNAMPRLAPAT